MNGTFHIGEIMKALLTKKEGIHVLMYLVVGALGFLLLFVLNHQKNASEKYNVRKVSGILAAGSACSCFGGIAGIWFLLLDNQYIVISESTDALVRGFSALIFGVLILVAGYLYKTNFFKTRELKDSYIDGKVVGTHSQIMNPADITERRFCLFPWQKKLIISYVDPYDEKEHIYKLAKFRSIRRYPVGSAYQLSYSADEHRAYDADSEKVNSYVMLAYYFLGGICIIAGIMWMVRGI